jgi:hypothetical protein
LQAVVNFRMEQPGLAPLAVPKKLIPAQAKLFNPKSEQFLATSKDKIRIMFGGQIELTPDEKQKIQDFKSWTSAKPDFTAALADPM